MHYKWPLTGCGGGGEGGKHLAPIVMVKKGTEIIHIIPTFRVLNNAPIKQTKLAKHGRLVNIPKWSKGVKRGPKC